MPNNSEVPHVVVVGAGVAGLASAYLIGEFGRRSGKQVDLTILEAKSEPGGSTRTDRINGYTCEWGPNGFLDNEPKTLELIRMLGIEGQLVRADESSSRRFIFHGGKLREIHINPLKFIVSDILSPWSKLRMASEIFISANKNNVDETVHSFGVRRLGKGFANYLLDPMVSGIFAGDIKNLSLKAVFPKMVEMEEQYGSLFKAMIAKKREAKKDGKKAGGPAGPGAVLYTFKNGMGELTETLSSLFRKQLRLSAPVRSIEKVEGRFKIAINGGSMDADAVVLACPSYKAADIIKAVDSKTSNVLADIPYAPVDVVCHGHLRENISHPLDGFGVLVPRSEKIRSLGCLWSDSIFPGQAPPGYHLLRTIMGGAHDPDIVDLADESLDDIARKDIKHMLGADMRPAFTKIFRHPKGIAQYTIGHLDRVAACEALEKNLPGLIFTGASYRGVSINGCVKDAFRVADQFWRIWEGVE